MPAVDSKPQGSSAVRARPEGRSRLLWATTLALLLHGLFVLLLLVLSHVGFRWPEEGKDRPLTQAVSLRPVTSQQWAQNRSTRAANERTQRERTAAKAPEPKRETTPKGQVVDVSPGNQEESPDAKFLAEKSNKVLKETKSKETTPFYRNAMPRTTTTVPRLGAGRDVDEQVAGNNGVGADDRPLRPAGEKRQMMEIPEVKSRAQVALKEPKDDHGPGAPVTSHPETENIRGNSKRLKIQQGQAGAGAEEGSQGHRGLPAVVNLSPSASTLDKVSGAAANDHLEDVDDGEGTFLNTKEWKFATFFNRVKQAVGMHWNPGEELRQRDPTLNIYGGRDRYTLLDITLNERGGIKEIHVKKSCGVEFLDSEAIAAFQRSQPFPNPPPGLLGSDASIHFQFGFFLEMAGGPKLKLFREPN